MEEGLLYLDSSALVKLVAREPESDALATLLRQWPERVTSEVAAVEVSRAARGASTDPALHERARQVVAATHLVVLDAAVLAAAETAGPPALPALAALHLASALELGDDLGAIVSYDPSLAAAAREAGLTVLAPGAR